MRKLKDTQQIATLYCSGIRLYWLNGFTFVLITSAVELATCIQKQEPVYIDEAYF